MLSSTRTLKKFHHLKPFVSMSIFIGSMFVLVFLQMEERRLGYELLRQGREQKKLTEETRHLSIQFARMTRLQSIEQQASEKLTLKKLSSKQIIHLSGLPQIHSKDMP
jgi:cell division protein FtsL